MVTIDVVYQGNLRSQATHGPSGTHLDTDAPKDNEGLGQSFSPTDLVATALGTCMITTMGIVARRRGLAFEGARASVAKHMVADPLRRIGKLEVAIAMPPGLADEARKVLEHTALTCPVHRNLHKDIDIQVQFRYA
jgi:putative redox protein